MTTPPRTSNVGGRSGLLGKFPPARGADVASGIYGPGLEGSFLSLMDVKLLTEKNGAGQSRLLPEDSISSW